MQNPPTFDKIVWQMNTPEVVKDMIKNLDLDLKQIQLILDSGWGYLNRAYIQSFSELNEMFKNKVDKTFMENFEKSIMQSIENCNEEIRTNDESNGQQFDNLGQVYQDLVKINEDIPHEEKHIQSIRLDYLQSAMQTQVDSLKNVQKYQNEAKTVSIGISQQLQKVKDRMLVDNNQIITLQTKVEKSQNDLAQSIKKYERQLPDAQKTYDTVRFNIKQQNLDNSFQTFNNIITDLKQENLKLVNDLSLTKMDYKQFELEQLLSQVERLEQLQLNYHHQFMNDLVETEKRLMELINSHKNQFQLQFQAFTDDMKVKSGQISDLITECFSNNQLQLVEKQITEAQQRWSDDIHNFRQKYIEGALKDVQDLIITTFEKTLVIDAANILQNARMFKNQLEEKHSQQKETQLSRKLHFEKVTQQLDQQLGVEHRRALQMATDRYEKIQKAVTHIGESFDAILKKVDVLMDSVEFAELIEKKLNKAAVDIAFSVQCPNEIYDHNSFIDTSQMSNVRVGGAPLNLQQQQTVQTVKERITVLKRQQDQINKSIQLNSNTVSNVQAKYDRLLIKIEDALNTLGFGKEKTKSKNVENIYTDMINYDDKRSQQLQHRVKNGAKAYRSRQWRTGIDLDNYITEFQDEFGKGGNTVVQ